MKKKTHVSIRPIFMALMTILGFFTVFTMNVGAPAHDELNGNLDSKKDTGTTTQFYCEQIMRQNWLNRLALPNDTNRPRGLTLPQMLEELKSMNHLAYNSLTANERDRRIELVKKIRHLVGLNQINPDLIYYQGRSLRMHIFEADIYNEIAPLLNFYPPSSSK